MTSKAESSPTGSSPRCVVCGRAAAVAYRPFCSKRCADVDLQRWLSGAYVIPGDAEDGPDETTAASFEED